MCVFFVEVTMVHFLSYLYQKRRKHLYFLVAMLFLNVLAVSQREYSVNLISFFITLFWVGILSADMHSDKDTEE